MTRKKLIELLKTGDFSVHYDDNGAGHFVKGKKEYGTGTLTAHYVMKKLRNIYNLIWVGITGTLTAHYIVENDAFMACACLAFFIVSCIQAYLEWNK